MSVTALVITNSRDTNDNSHKDNGIRNYFAARGGTHVSAILRLAPPTGAAHATHQHSLQDKIACPLLTPHSTLVTGFHN